MLGGLLVLKILAAGTLLMGSLAIFANLFGRNEICHPENHHLRRTTSGSPLFRSWVRGSLVAALACLLERVFPGRAGRLIRRREVPMKSGKKPLVRKTEDQWRAALTPLQFEVARCGGTEPPFTGKFNDHFEDGIYTCVCCGNEIFSSQAKFDAGCGWPSYWRAIADDAVTEMKEISYGTVRTEVLCGMCEAHLGHVFEDGPAPTGRRYCINSASLGFLKTKEANKLCDTEP